MGKPFVEYLVRALQQFDARERKDRALRQPGTVELLTVETSVERDEDLPDTVVLRSDLQIRLDSGDTISGPYLAYFKTDSPHAAKIHVGARLRCLVNPENAWKVKVSAAHMRTRKLLERWRRTRHTKSTACC